ncbi:cholinesterase 1-like [Ornithodoros turicata]|uniref:cholinesterase 1-like n=1 Tax=Ornithodoros turicata TaxID=34597 RepID=UPI0031390243
MSYFCLVVIVGLIALCSDFVVGDVDSKQPLVKTRYGDVAGIRNAVDGRIVNRFVGIPFAEPPTGKRRFRKPVPAKPWSRVLNATKYSPSCMQLPLQLDERLFIDFGPSAEDCLYLNVWQPQGAAKCASNATACKLRPVIVYIYGGGFVAGSGSFFTFRGDRFAAAMDIVYVTFNYRLGIFGFLQTRRPGYSGNAGLYDQLLALKWVKDNIKSFGGDPNLVTVWGQSAGAISLGYHMVSPLSKGLFQRAFFQSGTMATGLTLQKLNNVGNAQRVLGLFGCYNGTVPWKLQADRSIECLQKVDAKELLDRTYMELPLTAVSFLPSYGDDFLPSNPLQHGTNIKTGHEILISTTANEGSLFMIGVLLRNPHLRSVVAQDIRTPTRILMRLLLHIPNSKTGQLLDAYIGKVEKGPLHETQWKKDLSKLFGDVLFECSADTFTSVANREGHPVYRFLFNHRPTYATWDKWFGVGHGDDVAFTSGNTRQFSDSIILHSNIVGSKEMPPRQPTEEEVEFSHDIVKIIGSFAEFG